VARSRASGYDPLDEHGCLALEWEAFKAYVEAQSPAAAVSPGARRRNAEWSEDFCRDRARVGRATPGYTLLLEEADLVAEPGHGAAPSSSG